MVSIQSHRKDEHVSLAIKFYDKDSHAGFDQLRFIHQGIPEISFDDIDISTKLEDISMDFPIYIEAMTGGSEYTKKLNEKLARIAQKTGIAMATGSQSVALRDNSVSPSFEIVRKTNPNGIIFSNLGASATTDKAIEAIKMMDSNAIEIHINTPQEMVMPEGDRTFKWIDNIKSIQSDIECPVIVKEVGFGMSKETIQQLVDAGIKNINISGKGGTNFSQIENYRRKKQEMDYLKDWGQTTVESLLEAQPFKNKVNIISSGGIRTPLDAVKAMALGANSVGIAAPILYSLIKNGEEETVEFINEFIYGIKSIMTMLGTKSISDLQSEKMILSSDLLSYVHQRGLPY